MLIDEFDCVIPNGLSLELITESRIVGFFSQGERQLLDLIDPSFYVVSNFLGINIDALEKDYR